MRRHYKNKAYKKARRFYQLIDTKMSEEDLDRLAKRSADNLKVCSCLLCAGPRRLYGNSRQGKTIQEQKNLYNCD